MSISERLKFAREALGLKNIAVAKITKLGKSSISEFESDKREPSLSQLQLLAQAYNRPISFFFEKGPIARELVLWRKKPAPQTAKKIEVQFLELIKQYKNLEQWTNNIPRRQISELFETKYPGSYDKTECMAYEIRKKIGLGEQPGSSLFRILEEDFGVKIFYLSLGEDGSSACTWDDTLGAAILLNKDEKAWRRNFDVAHELFHLITWKTVLSRASDKEEDDRQDEQFANSFAASLLMPSDAFKKAIEEGKDSKGHVKYEYLESVARLFEVSLDAVFWRLKVVYCDSKENITKHLAKAKTTTYLPPRKELPSPEIFPARYFNLALTALRHGEISLKKFSEYTGESEIKSARYLSQHVPTSIKI